MSLIQTSAAWSPSAASQLEAATVSDTGPRAVNADAALVDVDAGLFAVCDGTGDTEAGASAARTTLDAIHERFALWPLLPVAERMPQAAAGHLERAVDEANGRLYLPGVPAEKKVGTTFAGVVVCGDELLVAHAGSSRVYHLATSGERRKLRRLTDDHTMLTGWLSTGVPVEMILAWGRRRAKALTNGIGLWPHVTLCTSVVPWTRGDTVLVASDGISDWVAPERMAGALVDSASIKASAAQLVALARAGGGGDNATAIVLRRGVEP